MRKWYAKLVLTGLSWVILFVSQNSDAKSQSQPTLGKPQIDSLQVQGLPFVRYFTLDKFGRKVTFYLSSTGAETTKYPLVVFIQGSGCDSLFVKVGDRIGGGIQNLLLPFAKGRARVLVVEKPGVDYLDQSKQPGTAEGCQPEFLKEHTLDRWAEAINTAIKAAQELPQIDTAQTLVVGHSEGGLVAARIASLNPKITHVASLAGGGPTQLFDLAETARTQPVTAASIDNANEVYEEWKKIQVAPDSTTKFFWGHPYRRWSSFLRTSVLAELSKSKAAIFLAQGTDDRAVSVAGFDMLRAELAAQGREVKVERIIGGDHTFSIKPSDIEGMRKVLSDVVAWFLENERRLPDTRQAANESIAPKPSAMRSK